MRQQILTLLAIAVVFSKRHHDCATRPAERSPNSLLADILVDAQVTLTPGERDFVMREVERRLA